MTLNARTDQVILRPVKRIEAESVSGIILPDLAREGTQRGVVVAAGPRCIEVRAGDEVLFEKYGGVMFHEEGEMLIRLEEGDVLAVVERAPGESAETPNIWLSLPAITRDKDRWRLS